MIINLTQHSASAEQLEAGVVNMQDQKLVSELLTFDELPSAEQIINKAEVLASLIHEPMSTQVLIGGAPWLMAPLINSLKKRGFVPVFAFSKRVSAEELQTDGSVKKISVFKHEGFIYAIE